MKNFLFFVLYLFFSNACLKAQGTWVQKVSISTDPRAAAVGFSIGSKGYIAMGGGYIPDLWEWDSGTNVWTQKADFPSGRRSHAIAFSIGNMGYVGLGYDNNPHWDGPTDLWEWNQSTNIWQQKANFPGIGRWGAVGFSIGTKGYVGTGTSTNDFWEWDQFTDTWIQKANFPGAPRQMAIGFSINNKGYIGTGGGSGGKIDFWEWNQLTNTWIQKTNFAGVPRYGAVGFSIGTKGYIGTGTDGNATSYNDFWEWDQTTDVWSQKTNFGGAPRNSAVGFSIGVKGYIGTGDNTSNGYNDFWEFTPSVLGIDGVKNNFSLNIFPNPSSGIFTIGFNKPNADTKIFIYDVFGNCVLSNFIPKELNQRIDLSNQPKGIYFIEMISGEQRQSKKIVLQ